MRAPDLILRNANVLTLDDGHPRASFLAVRGQYIAHVGCDASQIHIDRANTKVIDCAGMTIVPGFNDAHLHFLALASSLMAVDCSKHAVSSINDIQEAIRARATRTRTGQWISGYGYDETMLENLRHPTRADLDAAAPDHPVRLTHRTGHACVLNSRALEHIGISTSTPDPTDGVIQRDESGAPTGLLLEMSTYVSQRIGKHRDDALQGVAAANNLLLSQGITSFQDASHSNSVERFDAFCNMKLEGRLGPRVTVMPGIDHLEGFRARGLRYGYGNLDVRLGAAKVVLTSTTGTIQPPKQVLFSQVMEAQRQGYQVALHAVDQVEVATASEVLAAVAAAPDSHPGMRHRIEHASECPPSVLRQLQASQALVVSQPVFLYHSGENYLKKVPERMHPYLYRINSWLRTGLFAAFSSDAPIAPSDPLKGIYSAVTRCSEEGSKVAAHEGVDALTALRLYTIGGAYASMEEHVKGSIRPGNLADLVLLDHDPTTVEPAGIKDIRVKMTVVGGQVVWEL